MYTYFLPLPPYISNMADECTAVLSFITTTTTKTSLAKLGKPQPLGCMRPSASIYSPQRPCCHCHNPPPAGQREGSCFRGCKVGKRRENAQKNPCANGTFTLVLRWMQANEWKREQMDGQWMGSMLVLDGWELHLWERIHHHTLLIISSMEAFVLARWNDLLFPSPLCSSCDPSERIWGRHRSTEKEKSCCTSRSL